MNESPAPTPSGVHTLPPIVAEALLAALRKHGVVRASLFGSFAHGEPTETSDLDLLVTFDRPVSLFEQIDIASDLAAICGRPVDLVTELHPVFAPYILPTLVALPL